jgi:L-ascorbate metabolism protein UlaG (beta-lactamase superfamily)
LEGKIIYIDPYAGTDYADSADIVLITHEHSDHNLLSLVKQKSTCQVIRSSNAIAGGVYQIFTIGNIKITAVPAYNNQQRNLSWHLKSQCVGYVVEFNGIKLYHAGDTGNIPEMADLASQNITYALLPMDSIYTMSPAEATQAAAMIQAKHDIPIHTMPPPDTYSDAKVARFASPNKLIVRPGSTIELNAKSTLVEEAPEIPTGFSLSQNYPNPFNPTSIIRYSISRGEFVSLKIYDISGKIVETLVDREQNSGNYKITFNGSHLTSGIYLYRLQAGSFSDVKRMIFVK